MAGVWVLRLLKDFFFNSSLLRMLPDSGLLLVVL
jgi:hypothetical protein